MFQRAYSNRIDDNKFVIIGNTLDNIEEIIDYITTKDWCSTNHPELVFINKEPIEINKAQSIEYQILEKYKYLIKEYYESTPEEDFSSQSIAKFIGIFSDTHKYSIYIVFVYLFSMDDYTEFSKVDLSDNESILLQEGDGIYFNDYSFVRKIGKEIIRDLFQDNEKVKELRTRYTFSYSIGTDGDFTLFNRQPDGFEHYKGSFTAKTFLEVKNHALSTLQLMIDTHKGRYKDLLEEALESIKNDKPYYHSGNQELDIKINKSME
jgi:hypothetical protein